MKLTDEQKLKMDEYGIPERMQGGIIRYYENGIPPGDFLSAVIDNDLSEAVARADDENVHLLKAYVMWFYNQAPSGSWGREGSVQRWISEFRHD
jgi:hypothetical protein